MTAPDLRDCRQTAALDGITPADHYPVCDARADDPDQDALFDITPPKPEEGGPLL
jgi:hypothetical protein